VTKRAPIDIEDARARLQARSDGDVVPIQVSWLRQALRELSEAREAKRA